MPQATHAQRQSSQPVMPQTDTPRDAAGRFRNIEHPFTPGPGDILKWQLSANPFRAQKRSSRWRLQVHDARAFAGSSQDGLVWLGHAGFLLRLGGQTLLLDPVFGRLPLMPRYSAPPLLPSALKQLDYLLLSHDHRDHCDIPSIKEVLQRNKPSAVLSSLGMHDVLGPLTGKARLQLEGWYRQYSLPDSDLQVYFLPSRHWCRRGLTDTNRRLWGAFAIQKGDFTLYFGGDSGYGGHFAEAGRLFPNIDVAILGVGAFAPEWFMGPSHMSPADAVRAFADLGAKRLVPMHYGTFDLADEPIGLPLERLLAYEAQGLLPSGALCPLQPGQVLEIG